MGTSIAASTVRHGFFRMGAWKRVGVRTQTQLSSSTSR